MYLISKLLLIKIPCWFSSNPVPPPHLTSPQLLEHLFLSQAGPLAKLLLQSCKDATQRARVCTWFCPPSPTFPVPFFQLCSEQLITFSSNRRGCLFIDMGCCCGSLWNWSFSCWFLNHIQPTVRRLRGTVPVLAGVCASLNASLQGSYYCRLFLPLFFSLEPLRFVAQQQLTIKWLLQTMRRMILAFLNFVFSSTKWK